MRLIDADALLDAYDAAHKGPPGGARELIANAPTVNDWISVKDRMPENKKNVLVCLYDGRRKKVSNYPDGKRITIRIDRIVSDYGEPFWAKGNTPNVIAWMPLPEPPKEES